MTKRLRTFWPSLGALLLTAPAGVNALRPSQPPSPIVTITQLAADGSPLLNGRGFLIGEDGMLVTNYHLITQAAKLRIQTSNGDVYDQATIRVLDPIGDLAILKIPAFKTPALALARREMPAVGATVQVAVSPKAPATAGTRSGKVTGHYRLAPGVEAFAVDFALDAATRGCPVFDERGQCAGIATTVYQPVNSAAINSAARANAAGNDAPAIATVGAMISANRILDLLDDKMHQQVNRPLDLMDWSAWKPTPLDPSAEQLAALGLRRHWPRNELWTEKNQMRRLEMALSFDPTDSEIKVLLVRVHIQQRLFERARRQLDELLAAEQANSTLIELKGDLEYHSGNYDEARKTYRQFVAQGYHTPHNYNRKYDGVQLHGVIHQHFADYCIGPVIPGLREFVYLPGWPLDQIAVSYDKLKLVTIRPGLRAGQTVYEVEIKFAGPADNIDQTQKKEEIKLFITEKNLKEHLVSYLRQRGVDAVESAKR